MTRARVLLQLTGMMCTWMAPLLAGAADTVWISRGSETGQGTMVLLGERCLAVTAGHVVGDGKTPLTLVDAARNSSSARVLAVDATSDLALLEVPDMRGAGRALCSRTPNTIPVWSREQALYVGSRSSNVWLDKVNSASGELSRFNLILLSQAPPGRVHVDRASGRFGQIDPAPGDSGAPVWMARSPTFTPDRIYMPDGKPRTVPLPHRSLLGLYVGRSQGESVIVAGDRVRHFVLQALEALDPARVTLKPSTVKLHSAERGPFSSRGRERALEISASSLNTLSMELDLGRHETVVSAVTIHADQPSGKPAIRSLAKQRLGIHSSAYRPEAAGIWSKERCAPNRTRTHPVLRCEFSSPKVVRGLRLEIDGVPSSIRAIEIETQER